MLLNIGEKVHIVIRRAFEGDLRRHFVGEIMDASDTAIRVKGYSFIFDEGIGKFQRKPEIRIRIFSLIDARIIINIISPSSEIEKVTYSLSKDNNYVVTDGGHFQLDINEFGVKR